MSTSESDNVSDPQPVRRSKQSVKKDNSKLKKKIDSSKKFRMDQDEEDDGDELTSHLLESEEEGSLINSPQRRLSVTRKGSGSVRSPEPALGLAPLSPQASAEALELSQALERERSLTSSRDGLALDLIRDRNTIIELREEIRKLEKGNRPDHSWGFRTTNKSQAISGDRSQAQRDKPQSGGSSERDGSGSHSAPFHLDQVWSELVLPQAAQRLFPKVYLPEPWTLPVCY